MASSRKSAKKATVVETPSDVVRVEVVITHFKPNSYRVKLIGPLKKAFPKAVPTEIPVMGKPGEKVNAKGYLLDENGKVVFEKDEHGFNKKIVPMEHHHWHSDLAETGHKSARLVGVKETLLSLNEFLGTLKEKNPGKTFEFLCVLEFNACFTTLNVMSFHLFLEPLTKMGTVTHLALSGTGVEKPTIYDEELKAGIRDAQRPTSTVATDIAQTLYKVDEKGVPIPFVIDQAKLQAFISEQNKEYVPTTETKGTAETKGSPLLARRRLSGSGKSGSGSLHVETGKTEAKETKPVLFVDPSLASSTAPLTSSSSASSSSSTASSTAPTPSESSSAPAPQTPAPSLIVVVPETPSGQTIIMTPGGTTYSEPGSTASSASEDLITPTPRGDETPTTGPGRVGSLPTTSHSAPVGPTSGDTTLRFSPPTTVRGPGVKSDNLSFFKGKPAPTMTPTGPIRLAGTRWAGVQVSGTGISNAPHFFGPQPAPSTQPVLLRVSSAPGSLSSTSTSSGTSHAPTTPGGSKLGQ